MTGMKHGGKDQRENMKRAEEKHRKIESLLQKQDVKEKELLPSGNCLIISIISVNLILYHIIYLLWHGWYREQMKEKESERETANKKKENNKKGKEKETEI